MKKCIECNQDFLLDKEWALYCSNKCRNRAHSRRYWERKLFKNQTTRKPVEIKNGV